MSIDNSTVRKVAQLARIDIQEKAEEEKLIKELNNISKLIKPNSVVLDIGAQTGNMAVAYSLFAKNVIGEFQNFDGFVELDLNNKKNNKAILSVDIKSLKINYKKTNSQFFLRSKCPKNKEITNQKIYYYQFQ